MRRRLQTSKQTDAEDCSGGSIGGSAAAAAAAPRDGSHSLNNGDRGKALRTSGKEKKERRLVDSQFIADSETEFKEGELF